VAPLVLAVSSGCLPRDLLSPHATFAPPAGTSEDLRGARALDQQGVIAFEAGRYRDAVLYFDAAYAHGGPPSERWNAAKSYLRLDQAEQAETELVAYLGLPGLTADDRREAVATLEALRRRPSVLTVTSTPPGLTVLLDARKVGVTPLSAVVAAGDHAVAIEHGAEAREDRPFTAKLGRAVLLEAHP
jgi:hypothetical protein